MRISLLVTLFFISINVYAQTLSLEYFNKPVFSTDYVEAENTDWPSMNNSEGLSLIKGGQYIVQQRSQTRENLIFPSWTNPYNDYEVHASIRLQKGATGLCFDFDREKKSGYIFIINGKQKFSLIRINNNGERSYPGYKNERKSWQKFSILANNGMANEIHILLKDDQAEIYINGFFAKSYSIERNPEQNHTGIYVAPLTNIAVNFYKVVINEDDYKNTMQQHSHTGDTTELNTADTKAVDLIFNLRKKLSEMEADYKDVQLLLDKCREDNVHLDQYIRENLDIDLQKKVEILEEKNKELQNQNISLKKDNEVLRAYKEKQSGEGEDNDLIDFLYDELGKEQQKNAELRARIEKLEKELKRK